MNIPLAMTTARVMLDPSHGWTLIRAGATTFWFKGHERTRDAAGLVREAAGLGGDRRAAEAWLRNLDGHFALVIETPGWTLAAADRVGSIPLIWTRRTGEMLVTQDGPGLERALGLGPGDINPDAAVSVALAGYTIGADTLYRGVRRLTPGQYLWVDGDGDHLGAYHQWRPWLPSDAAPDDLVAPLTALHERIIDKLVAGAGGRPILVPLSAGLDSRLILSGLVAAGYRNVRAFTYGLPGNREAVMAGRIAARLGVDWNFVPYDVGRLRHAMAAERHRDYESYADALTGIHFPQDWLALTEMMAEHGVGPETIVVNGQTGDFITGNHILPPLTEPAIGASPAERMERILAVAIAKHFKLWHALQAPRWLDPVRRRLREDIEDAGGLPESPLGDHGVCEYSEMVNRQSKYVIHGQRLYEFLGLGWRLPLWDRDYLDFWEKAPLAAKRGQALYRTALAQADWGGVWRDLPVNPRRVRPGWAVPIRLALKALHAPLGRTAWHRFEKRYLEYWMAPICSYAPWPYGRIVRDRRGHANALAWYAEAYLNGKGLAWDGTPIRP